MIEPQAIQTPNKYFNTYGWHAYNWTTYYQPPDGSNGVAAWQTVTVAADPQDPTAAILSMKANTLGQGTAQWGERSGAYNGRKPPVPLIVGTAVNIRIDGLKRKKQYFFSAVNSWSQPATATSVANSGSTQSTEVSLTTT